MISVIAGFLDISSLYKFLVLVTLFYIMHYYLLDTN